MTTVQIKPPRPSVPRLWPGETFVCVASGPSLMPEDVEYVRGKARVIAINASYALAPWADVIYACDAKVWRWYWNRGPDGYRDVTMRDCHGLKYGLTKECARYPGVTLLHKGTTDGLSLNPQTLCTGANSGYQAINLAVHLGAARILLIGYDMQPGARDHWHADHPDRTRSPYEMFRRYYDTIIEPLKIANVSVINCSRETGLKAFPRQPLREALPEPRAEAVA